MVRSASRTPCCRVLVLLAPFPPTLSHSLPSTPPHTPFQKRSPFSSTATSPASSPLSVCPQPPPHPCTPSCALHTLACVRVSPLLSLSRTTRPRCYHARPCGCARPTSLRLRGARVCVPPPLRRRVRCAFWRDARRALVTTRRARLTKERRATGKNVSRISYGQRRLRSDRSDCHYERGSRVLCGGRGTPQSLRAVSRNTRMGSARCSQLLMPTSRASTPHCPTLCARCQSRAPA